MNGLFLVYFFGGVFIFLVLFQLIILIYFISLFSFCSDFFLVLLYLICIYLFYSINKFFMLSIDCFPKSFRTFHYGKNYFRWPIISSGICISNRTSQYNILTINFYLITLSFLFNFQVVILKLLISIAYLKNTKWVYGQVRTRISFPVAQQKPSHYEFFDFLFRISPDASCLLFFPCIRKFTTT